MEIIAKYMETSSIIRKPTSTSSSSTLYINSKEIKQDLANMGITGKKSLVTPFPNVPEEYLPSFVRGVIDGDGWVQDRGYIMTVTGGSQQFSNALFNVFQSWELHSYIKTEITKTGNAIYRVKVSGKHDLSRLSESIYANCTNDCVFHKKERMSQHRDCL